MQKKKRLRKSPFMMIQKKNIPIENGMPFLLKTYFHLVMTGFKAYIICL